MAFQPLTRFCFHFKRLCFHSNKECIYSETFTFFLRELQASKPECVKSFVKKKAEEASKLLLHSWLSGIFIWSKSHFVLKRASFLAYPLLSLLLLSAKNMNVMNNNVKLCRFSCTRDRCGIHSWCRPKWSNLNVKIALFVHPLKNIH